MKRISKTISVTINLETLFGERGYWVNFDFVDGESGDTYGYNMIVDGSCEAREEDSKHISDELLSWVSFMADELEESEVC